MIRKILFAMLLTVGLTGLNAFDRSDPLGILGYGIDSLFKGVDVPREVFPYRGVESDEDNVVFYYEGGFYLFLFGNRIWQVRYDRTAENLPFGLSTGEERSLVLASFLENELVPLSSNDDSVTFQLRESPWPVRATLYFAEEKLDDLYIYRADF